MFSERTPTTFSLTVGALSDFLPFFCCCGCFFPSGIQKKTCVSSFCLVLRSITAADRNDRSYTAELYETTLKIYWILELSNSILASNNWTTELSNYILTIGIRLESSTIQHISSVCFFTSKKFHIELCNCIFIIRIKLESSLIGIVSSKNWIRELSHFKTN